MLPRTQFRFGEAHMGLNPITTNSLDGEEECPDGTLEATLTSRSWWLRSVVM